MFYITLEGADRRVVTSLKERIFCFLGLSHTLRDLWRRRSCQDDDFPSSFFEPWSLRIQLWKNLPTFAK